ncbi:hypothetical protein [Sessilibacter corallicola]|uniref:Serine/threonine protein kinase n=1 Tax=Sessilibacter corallicola TaxID=2904075 RepID=A0ABQ0A6I5_9GAMM
MDIKKLVLATAVFGALGGLYGCSGDEDATITIDDNSVTTTTTTSTTTTGGNGANDGFFDDQDAIDASVAAIPGASTRQVVRMNPTTGQEVAVTAVQLPASIMTDVTLDSDVLYFLNSRVTVGNGNAEMTATDGVLVSGDPLAEVTFTIEAGTEIVGNSDTFANLLITRGSQIMAMGTAAEPIVFSSDDTDIDGSGEWGGLILQGFGRTNLCTYPEDMGGMPVACNFDGEGESGFAGGHDNTDNSGVLNYVVVAEAGFEFAIGNEINGISFLSVGSATEVDFIQVHNNADDGVEFYGGAVNVSHVVLTGNQDESIDWDEGYVGNIQFALVIQDEGSDHAIEADTLGNPGFLSAPSVVNATFLGAGDGFSELHRLKDTTGGFIHNSVLTSVSGMPLDVCVALEDADTLTNAMNDAIAYNNVIADCTEFETSDGTPSMLLDRDTVTLTAGLVDTTTYASSAVAADGLTPIDFTAFDATHPESMASQAGDFFEDTDYAGAVEPGAASLWFEGWTVEGSL